MMPLDTWETDSLLRHGNYREEIGSDDIDIRVKYAGMFHRKKATPGRFMMRLRLPNGIISSNDMR